MSILTTLTANKFVFTDSNQRLSVTVPGNIVNDILPSQFGYGGYALKTNGSNVYWDALGVYGNMNFVGAWSGGPYPFNDVVCYSYGCGGDIMNFLNLYCGNTDEPNLCGSTYWHFLGGCGIVASAAMCPPASYSSSGICSYYGQYADGTSYLATADIWFNAHTCDGTRYLVPGYLPS